MSSYLARYVGAEHLPRKLSDFDVETYFRLTKEAIAAIEARFKADRLPRSSDRQVGLAVQLVYLQTTGRTSDRVQVVPPALLRYLGRALSVPAPSITSLRAIYKRRATLYEHQQWAKQFLGLRAPEEKETKELSAVLGAQAGEVTSIDELVTLANNWLFDRKLLLPSTRAVTDMAREAFLGVERDALRIIRAKIDAETLEACRKHLFEPREKDGPTVLEWLKAAPRRHSPSTLADTLGRVKYLKNLGVHAWHLDEIPLARQRAWAHAMASRPPSESRRRKDARQMLEAVCFLRIALLEMTDAALFLTGRRISDLVRHAAAKTQKVQARSSVEYRARLSEIKTIASDATKSAEERLQAILGVIEPLGDLRPNSKAAVVRDTLVDDPNRVRSLLKAVSDLDFKGAEKDPAMKQLAALRQLEADGAEELPKDFPITVDKPWRDIVNGEDRMRALSGLQASAALALRRSLRRGSVSVPYSMTFRERDQMIIPEAEWSKQRERHIERLGLKATADEFLTPILKLCEAGLQATSEALAAGKIEIGTDGQLHLHALGALADEPKAKQMRDAMFREIGDVQLPDLLLQVDAATNFSEALLGRRPRDVEEVIGCYAGLLAIGTETDAKGIAAMMPQLDPARVPVYMRAIESPGRVRRANDRVQSYQRQHSITECWGSGELGSSDSMSVDASRHLWNARVDPRRRTYAVGLYTHILDTHGLAYGQPVVLNERQVGPAIEGVVRYNETGVSTRLSRLAVDTHGYTHPGMAFAKGVGFDLCPRLRNISERKLFVPRGMEVPESLEPVIAREVSIKAIRRGWEEYLRAVASVLTGRVSAAVLMQRLGSAAQGDHLHSAADSLGKLLRTVYLCDYFSNTEFRREIHTILNRGESAHQLQRAIYTGKIAPERGRRRDELVAISGAHTLLTNIVIAWNTHRMQEIVDRSRRLKHPLDEKWIARVSPTHFGHINFRGQMSFSIGPYAAMILDHQAARNVKLGRAS